jgi:hypothetical protein
MTTERDLLDEEISTTTISRVDAHRISRILSGMPYGAIAGFDYYEFGRPRGEDLLEEFDLERTIRNLERLRRTLVETGERIERDRVALHALERDRAAMLRLLGEHDYSRERDMMLGRYEHDDDEVRD